MFSGFHLWRYIVESSRVNKEWVKRERSKIPNIKYSHGGRENKGHVRLCCKSRQDLHVLLQHLCINGAHPAACSLLVIDEDDGRILDAEGLGEVAVVVHFSFFPCVYVY